MDSVQNAGHCYHGCQPEVGTKQSQKGKYWLKLSLRDPVLTDICRREAPRYVQPHTFPREVVDVITDEERSPCSVEQSGKHAIYRLSSLSSKVIANI